MSTIAILGIVCLVLLVGLVAFVAGFVVGLIYG